MNQHIQITTFQKLLRARTRFSFPSFSNTPMFANYNFKIRNDPTFPRLSSWKLSEDAEEAEDEDMKSLFRCPGT